LSFNINNLYFWSSYQVVRPFQILVTTNFVRRSFIQVSITITSVPVFRNQYIIPQQLAYNTISTGSAGLI